MSIEYRDYRSGDEYQIIDLFRHAFNKDLWLDLWKWRYFHNPFGSPIIKMAFNNDKLIGHYALVPSPVQMHGHSLKALYSMTTMIEQDYRGSDIIVQLAKQSYKEASKLGYEFIYAFPNANSYLPFQKLLGWHGNGSIKIYCRSVPQFENLNLGGIKRVNIFDSNIDALWREEKPRFSLSVQRTSTYLNWRYSLYNEGDYPKFVLVDDGKVKGYIILKIYQHDGEKHGHILDVFCQREDNVMQRLFNCAYKFIGWRRTQDISCWCYGDEYLAQALELQGFIASGANNANFAVKVLNHQNYLNEYIHDGWHLSMGDSDVF